MGEIGMRSSPALVLIDPPVESAHVSIDSAIRTLVGLSERGGDPGATDFGSGNASEEVLLDTEVDGSRYLLLRMPKSPRSRIQLSPRELEIVRMVAKGHPNKVNADVLNISSCPEELVFVFTLKRTLVLEFFFAFAPEAAGNVAEGAEPTFALQA
jgi:regulatory LuxR family protein